MRAPYSIVMLFILSLPLYAAAAGDAATTATETATTSDTSYTLRPGDIVHINVWKEEDLDREVTILPDGTLDFPLIGSVSAKGLTPAKLKELITEKLVPYVPAASVTVMVKETRGNSVSVVGQVAKPGDIVMTENLTVMQALSKAGGPTAYADENSIVILRKVDGKETSIDFDYSDIARGRDLETNITLQPGDVIVVPAASLF